MLYSDTSHCLPDDDWNKTTGFITHRHTRPDGISGHGIRDLIGRIMCISAGFKAITVT